jgi:hypothetical protein
MSTLSNTRDHLSLQTNKQGIDIFRRYYDNVLAAIFLIVVLMLFYRDVVFGGRTFLTQSASSSENTSFADPGAIAWQLEPYNYRASNLVKAGYLPLWNPSAGLGSPFMADGNSAAVEPLTFLFYLLPESEWPTAMDAQVLIRFWLAGFFSYLFARNLGLSMVPGLAAACSYMLCSYFVDFGNHPQMKPETLLPLILYSFYRLARNHTLGNVLLTGLAVCWILLASFPESGFLALMLGGSWYLYYTMIAAWSVHFDRRFLIEKILHLVLASVIGFGLSLFFVAPLVENINQSLHVHDPGAGMWHMPSNLFVFGIFRGILPWSPHFYTMTIALALIGGISGLGIPKQRASVMFFLAYGLIFYLKIYGFGLVQWIGQLPLLNQIILMKYVIPSVSFCFAIVAAFGIQAFIDRNVSLKMASIVILTFSALILYVYVTPDMKPYWDKVVENLSSIVLIIFVLATIFSMSIVTRFSIERYVISIFLLAMTLSELFILHAQFHRLLRSHPFTERPFISYLKSRTEIPYRVLGLDSILLHPEISTAFGIDDIRYLAALVSKRRFLYFTQFIAPGMNIPIYLMEPGDSISRDVVTLAGNAIIGKIGISDANELVDRLTRFTGWERPYLGTQFDLLNTTYVVTSQGLPSSTVSLRDLPSTGAILARDPSIIIRDISVSGDNRQAIFMHPPSQVKLPLLLPSGTILLKSGFGIDPFVWQTEEPLGDGVSFIITVTDDVGEHIVLQHYIDPKNKIEDREWKDFMLDLSPWSGKKVIITLRTEGGPNNDTQADWAYFSMPVLYNEASVNPWAKERLAKMDRINLIGGIVSFNRDRSLLGPSQLAINNDLRGTLFLHTPNFADLEVQVPDTQTLLRFGIGIDPQAWTVSDGAQFRVVVIENDHQTIVYDRFIDPKHNFMDRRWIDETVDLSNWQNRRIKLRFITSVGPFNYSNNAADWAHWSDITLLAKGIGLANPQIARFQPVYIDQEVRIYQNNFAYPRAFVVHEIVPSASTDESIRLLSQPSFDPSRMAVVENAPIEEWDMTLTDGLTPLPTAAEVIEQTPNSVRIRTITSQPGLLFVSDTFDYGWKAYINGSNTEIVPTNVFMRGVYVNKGESEVLFVYEPLSFKIGSYISIISLIAIICATIFKYFIESALNSEKKVYE